MGVLIVSDDAAIARRVSALLPWEGEHPMENVLSLDRATKRVEKEPPQLMVLVLPPKPERAFAVLDGLRPLTNCRVVAVGPTGDYSLVLRALHAGATDYVGDGDLETELRSAITRIQNKSETVASQKQGTLYAILAPSGGSGSSTLAVNLATVFARQYKTALLIDLKLQTGDLAALLDLKPAYTIADLCTNLGNLDRTMFERSLAQHASGISLLAAPNTREEPALVTAAGVRQTLSLGRPLFPKVVVDVDRTFGAEQLLVLTQADILLLVMRLEFTCLRHIRRSVDYLEQQGVNRDRMRIVANRHGQSGELSGTQVEDALGVKLHHCVPDDPASVNRANNHGVPVVVESPASRVSRSLVSLAASINGRPH